VQFSPTGDIVASGAEDGTARLWHIDAHLCLTKRTVLNMRKGEDQVQVRAGAQAAQTPSVKMVIFSLDGQKVITSQALEKKSKKDSSLQVRIKVWLAHSGELLHTFKDHHLPVYVLSTHPSDARIIMSAGYDSQVFLWDLETGIKVRSFQIAFPSDPDRLNPPDFDEKFREILDGQFHPDGNSFIVAHKNGFVTIFSNKVPLRVPTEQFFQTDFGELTMDAGRNVIDTQHQIPPHLLQTGFMTDRFGNIYDEQNMSARELSMPVLVAPRIVGMNALPGHDHVTVSDADDDGDFVMLDSDSSASSSSESESESPQGSGDDYVADEYTSRRREGSRKRRTRQREKLSQRAQRRRARIVESFEHDHDSDSAASDSDFAVRKRTSGGSKSKKKRESAADLRSYTNRSRQWLKITEPPHDVDDDYIPQPGDVVIYFHQGHLACLEGGYPDTSRFPLDMYKKLRTTEKCKVVSVKYQLPEPHDDEDQAVFCVLGLQVMPDDEQDDQRQARHRSGKFAEGDRVLANWGGKPVKYPGVVQRCNPDGTYAVKYDDGDFSKRVQAKNVESLSFEVSYRRTLLAEFVIPLYRYERNKGKRQFRPGDRFCMKFDKDDTDGGMTIYRGAPCPRFMFSMRDLPVPCEDIGSLP
jgi:hypothetical protein